MAGIDHFLAMGVGNFLIPAISLRWCGERPRHAWKNPLPEFRHTAGLGHTEESFPTEFDVADRLL